jgi:hypothetical protein
MLGWLSIAVLDLWAGIDVFAGSGGSDASSIVDRLGKDSVVDSRHVSQPDLIALIVGLLVLVALVGLWAFNGVGMRRWLGRVLVVCALTSVVTLAVGGHMYALLAPVGLLVGGIGHFGARPALVTTRRPRPVGPDVIRRGRPRPRT